MAPFVLDQVDNPHPRMRRAALEYRRRALVVRQAITDQLTVPDVATVGVLLRWETYLECMCDATGCTAAERTSPTAVG